MFIAHGEWMRRNARWLLAGILLLLIPGFVALFSQSGGLKKRDADLPTIGGKPVNPADYQAARAEVAGQYLMSTGRQLPRTAQMEDQVTQEAVVQMVLLRKARAMGIHVSDEELVRHLHNMQVFRNQMGQFDPERYRQFLIYLNNYGINEAQFERTLRDQVTLLRLRDLIGTGAKVTPSQVALIYAPLHERLAVDLVTFDTASYHEPVTVTVEEAKTYFEQNKESFRRPAKVKVRYVRFPFEDAKKSITVTDEEITQYYDANKTKFADPKTGTNQPLSVVKDRVRDELVNTRAERATGDRSTEFTIKLVPEPGTATPNFAKAAAEAGLSVQETDYFALHDTVKGVEAGPMFNQVAFSLSPDSPISDPVRGTNSYYVMEYVDKKPSELPSFDEVKTQVEEQLKKQRIYDATLKRARDAAEQIKKAMASGKTFADVAKELGLKVTSPPPFSVSDQKTELPAESRVKQIALGMATNTVSEIIPTADGAILIHLKQRLPPADTDAEKAKEQLENDLLNRHRQALYEGWINQVIRDENVNFGRKHSLAKATPETEAEEPTEPPATPAAAPSAAPPQS